MTSASRLNPSSDAVREQLDRILSSPEFAVTEKLKEFLRFVVEETLSGRAGELKAYTIAISVYGRESDFDATYDPLVRIQAGKLRRALERYYLLKDKAEPIRIDVPKGTYVPVFVLTEEPDTASSPRSSSPTQHLPTPNNRPSIAVLPFVNLTGDPQRDYFVAGFAEELAIELTRYEDIRVIGYQVAPSMVKVGSDPSRFRQEVDANFRIEGSVRMKRDQVKISIKLTETNTGEYLWGDHYQRDLTAANLIDIQEEIARETVASVASEYGIIPQRLTRESRTRKPADLDTYDAILRFYYHLTQHTTETFMAAFQALEQATARDPQCAIAKAMLANMYGDLYMLDQPRNENSLKRMQTLADEAINLDPNNQWVRIIHSLTHFVLDEKEAFFAEMDKALALNPNSPFRIGVIGFFLCLYGEWERGKALLDSAINQNVYLPAWQYGATTIYYYRLKEYERAYYEALKYEVPALFWSPLLRAASLGQLGREKEARLQAAQLKKLRPDFENKARELMRRYIKEAELIDHLLQGLHKAGMKVAE